MRVAAIAAVVSVAVASCGGRTTTPPSAAANKPVTEAGTGSVQEPVPLALADATYDAGGASDTTGDPEADRDGGAIAADRADASTEVANFCGCHDASPPCRAGVLCSLVGIKICGKLVCFARNSTRPTPESDEGIAAFASVMKDNPSMKVEVIGHASNDEAGWQRISAARAAAVVASLVRAGVDGSCLVARGERSAPAPWAPPPAGDPNAANVAKEKEAWLTAHRIAEFHVTDPGHRAYPHDSAAPDICKMFGCGPR